MVIIIDEDKTNKSVIEENAEAQNSKFDLDKENKLHNAQTDLEKADTLQNQKRDLEKTDNLSSENSKDQKTDNLVNNAQSSVAQDKQIEFDFVAGQKWFALKYLHVLSERILWGMFCLILSIVLLFIPINLMKTFPLNKTFLITKISNDSLNKFFVIKYINSLKNKDSVEIAMMKYLIKKYIHCRENWANDINSTCYLFLKNYSNFTEFRKIQVDYEDAITSSDSQNKEQKIIEISDIVLYNVTNNAYKSVGSFLIDLKVMILEANEVVNIIRSSIKLQASIADLSLVKEGVIEFDFNILTYDRLMN